MKKKKKWYNESKLFQKQFKRNDQNKMAGPYHELCYLK